MVRKSFFILLCVGSFLFSSEKKQNYTKHIKNYFGTASITTGGCLVGWGSAVKNPKLSKIGILIAASGFAYNYFVNNAYPKQYSQIKEQE